MTRNTHDRQLDHHSTDLASNVELDGATTNYADGDLLQGVIADIDDRIDAGGGGGGGGLSDLITGDDADFIATVGGWTASAGTLTRDATYQINGQTASLKWVCPTSGTNSHIDLPIVGTFRQGVSYAALVYLSLEAAGSNFVREFNVELGVPGTDSFFNPMALTDVAGVDYPGIGDGAFVAAVAYWVPTADRTTVVLRIKATGNSGTLHVGAARVWETPTVGSHKIGSQHGVWPADEGDSHLTPWGTNTGFVVNNQQGRTSMTNFTFASGFQTAQPSFHYAYVWAEHPPADLSFDGIELDIGDDYQTIIIGQKSSMEVQLYGYDDVDNELRDQGTGHWKVTNPGDTLQKPLILMECRRSAGTATITTGTTTVTVTHGAGYTPIASDIVVTPTNNPTNAPGNFWIANIGATTFDIKVRSDPGASGATFAWRVDQ